MKFGRLVAQTKTATVGILPAVLAPADANHGGGLVTRDVPFLVTLVGTVGAEAADMELQLNALVALCIHLAHFESLVAHNPDHLEGVDVAVAKVVCKFLVVAAMAVAVIAGAKLAPTL